MLKRLSRCVREYRNAAILSPLCMVGEVAMEVLIPTVMATLIDFGIEKSNMGVVVGQGALLALCALCSLAFGVPSATTDHSGIYAMRSALLSSFMRRYEFSPMKRTAAPVIP